MYIYEYICMYMNIYEYIHIYFYVYMCICCVNISLCGLTVYTNVNVWESIFESVEFLMQTMNACRRFSRGVGCNITDTGARRPSWYRCIASFQLPWLGEILEEKRFFSTSWCLFLLFCLFVWFCYFVCFLFVCLFFVILCVFFVVCC